MFAFKYLNTPNTKAQLTRIVKDFKELKQELNSLNLTYELEVVNEFISSGELIKKYLSGFFSVFITNKIKEEIKSYILDSRQVYEHFILVKNEVLKKESRRLSPVENAN